MNMPSYFKEFLSAIEPSPSYKDDQKAGHTTLRKRLASDDDFKAIYVNSFLQGSYKRSTAIHPGKDVDIVVVTSLDPDRVTAADANARLGKCLRRYYEKVEPQTRSFGVRLSYVTMDVVLATSRYLKEAVLFESIRKADQLENASGWIDHPLLIPDRDLGRWVETDPKEQLAWTTRLNAECGDFFVPLVKMFKWWRKEAYTLPKYPKGYVLERIAGECVDTSIRDHAEGFVKLLENVLGTYRSWATIGVVPILPDPGVPSHNVAHRLSAEDFKAFIKHVEDALPIARAALLESDGTKSAERWSKVFGDKFPEPVAKASFPDVPVRPNKPAGFA